MKSDLSQAIEQLVQEAPGLWLETVCAGLQSCPAGVLAENMLHRLPPTHNGDLAYQLAEVIRVAYRVVSWESLSFAIAMCSSVRDRWQIEHKTELAIYVTPRLISPASEKAKDLLDDARSLHKEAAGSVSFSIFD